MTDRFEEAVRQAARGLGEQGPNGLHHDTPTYHDAWQRGRRRRFVKRSALAAAGALVFIAALSVNLGRFPGTDSTDVDDVAVVVAAVTPSFVPTPLATTSPVGSPTAAPVPTVPIPTAPPTQPTAGSSAESAVPAATAAPAPPTATAPPVATDVPVQTVETTPAPTTAAATGPTATPDPAESADSSQSPEVTPEAATQPTPEGTTATDGLSTEPELAFTTAGPGQPADVIVLEPANRLSELACDIDQDGKADATCDLLPDYVCDSDTKVEPGYEPIDSDNDGTVDMCRAVGLTICDTTGDGVGDTPCIVELIPAADLAEGALSNDE